MSSKRTPLYVSVVLFFVTISTGIVLSSGGVLADDVVDNVSITVPEVCTLSSQTGTGETYNVSMSAGQYKNDIGDTTLSVLCNDAGGFSIYAVGFSGETIGNNKMITNDPNTFIATGTATSGNTSNWAMKLTAVTGSGAGVITPTVISPFNNFAAVPASYTKVVTVNPAVDIGTSAQVKARYAVFVSGSQVVGTYTGKVRYTIVHPATEVPLQPQDTPPGYIGYFPNANGVVDTMGDQVSFPDYTQMLWPSNFVRPGYGFAGWSTTFDYSDPGGFYGPNEDITTPSTLNDKGLSLYAYWVPSAGNMQNWSGCGAMSVGNITALTDTRDNNTYAVAKLADGMCWMIENLRLDNSAVLSATNTHNPSLPLTNNYSTSSTSNSLSPTSTSDWCSETTAACIDQSRVRTDNTSNTTQSMDGWDSNVLDQNIYSYGNYYNWYSATAGSDTFSMTSTVASGDICPYGWHLPYGGSSYNPEGGNTSGGFSYLATEIGATNFMSLESSRRWRKFPNNFLLSGTITKSSNQPMMLRGRGNNSVYWSSAKNPSSSKTSYGLVLSSQFAQPGTASGTRPQGVSVRCVAGV